MLVHTCYTNLLVRIKNSRLYLFSISFLIFIFIYFFYLELRVRGWCDVTLTLLFLLPPSCIVAPIGNIANKFNFPLTFSSTIMPNSQQISLPTVFLTSSTGMDCCGNHLSQRQMITQTVNLLVGYQVVNSQENLTRSLC